MKSFFSLIAVLPGNSPDPKNSQNRLRPCPASPNCVSSLSRDRKHYIPPLQYSGSLSEAGKRLLAVIRKLERSRVLTEEEDYIHAEFRSRIMGFRDDTEFWFPRGEKIIHVRSASRIGYSDLGANRKRVEQIRAAFEK